MCHNKIAISFHHLTTYSSRISIQSFQDIEVFNCKKCASHVGSCYTLWWASHFIPSILSVPCLVFFLRWRCLLLESTKLSNHRSQIYHIPYFLDIYLIHHPESRRVSRVVELVVSKSKRILLCIYCKVLVFLLAPSSLRLPFALVYRHHLYYEATTATVLLVIYSVFSLTSRQLTKNERKNERQRDRRERDILFAQQRRFAPAGICICIFVPPPVLPINIKHSQKRRKKGNRRTKEATSTSSDDEECAHTISKTFHPPLLLTKNPLDHHREGKHNKKNRGRSQLLYFVSKYKITNVFRQIKSWYHQ